jgi:hypothetical protein
MVGLPCLVSQCGNLHVAAWTCAVFTRVSLESCMWPVAIFTMDHRNRECASHFVPIMGKVLWRPSQWFNKPSGTKSWVVHRCFNDMPSSRLVAHQLTITNTQRDPQSAQLLKLLHEFKSSSVRIDVGPFPTWVRRWELVMGHANMFWQKNWWEKTWLLHHNNAPSLTSLLTQQFLAKYKMAVIPHPLYSPDLTPCDFFLFPKMKRAPVRYRWGDPGWIAESAWHSDRKGLPGSVPKMEETVEMVPSWGR